MSHSQIIVTTLAAWALLGTTAGCGRPGADGGDARGPTATPVSPARTADRALVHQDSPEFFAPVAPAELASCTEDEDCTLRSRTCYGVCCGQISETNVIALAEDETGLYAARVCHNHPSECFTCWVEEPNLVAVCTDGRCRVAAGP